VKDAAEPSAVQQSSIAVPQSSTAEPQTATARQGRAGLARFFWAPTIGAFRSGFEPGVQAARALAAIMVIFVHLFSIGVAAPEAQFDLYLKWQHLTQIIRLDTQNGANVGVFVFFIVSGYIVSQVAVVERGATFLIKRAARLMPAMMLAVVLAVTVGMTFHAMGRVTWYLFDTDHALSWRAVLEGLGFGAIRPIRVLFPLWTLAVEYYWYFLLFVFMRLCRSRPVLGTVLMEVGLAVMFWASPAIAFRSFGFERTWIVPVAVVLIVRWVYLVRCGLGLIPGVAGALSAVALYLKLDSIRTGDHTQATHIAATLTILWSTAIFCLLLVVLHKPLWRPVNLLADLSYGIYLYHIPIAWVLLTTLVPHGGRWMAPTVFLAFAATIAFAFLSHTFVEKPVRDAVRRRLRNRAQRTPGPTQPGDAPTSPQSEPVQETSGQPTHA
jgi:exopolysaccharide production protein ExoZ